MEAAKNAGMKCGVLATAHGAEDFAAYDNMLFFAKDYLDEKMLELLRYY